jgi:hypothetical protein
VWHSIAEEVEEHSERQRAQPRTNERAAGGAGRNVQGDDQASTLAARRPRVSVQYEPPSEPVAVRIPAQSSRTPGHPDQAFRRFF